MALGTGLPDFSFLFRWLEAGGRVRGLESGQTPAGSRVARLEQKHNQTQGRKREEK